MPQAGDRVLVQGNKIGSPTRVGTLVKTVGTMIRVRWENGTESLFQPGAGSVTYETSRSSARKAAGRPAAAKGAAGMKKAAPPKAAAAPKKAAAKAAPKAARKPAAAKKVTAKKAASKKSGAKRR